MKNTNFPRPAVSVTTKDTHICLVVHCNNHPAAHQKEKNLASFCWISVIIGWISADSNEGDHDEVVWGRMRREIPPLL